MTADVLVQMDEARFLMDREGLSARAASAVTGLSPEIAATIEIDMAKPNIDHASRQFDAYVERQVAQQYETWAMDSHDEELDRVDKMISALIESSKARATGV